MWAQFKINMLYWWHYATVWVVSLWGAGYAIWQTVDDATRVTYYAMVPFGLGRYIPIILLLVAYFTANGWPQPKLVAKLDAKKADLAADAQATIAANQAGA